MLASILQQEIVALATLLSRAKVPPLANILSKVAKGRRTTCTPAASGVKNVMGRTHMGFPRNAPPLPPQPHPPPR